MREQKLKEILQNMLGTLERLKLETLLSLDYTDRVYKAASNE